MNVLREAVKTAVFRAMRLMPMAWRLRINHLRETGRALRLRDPLTFNDFLALRKLGPRDPRLTAWSDKVRAKELAAEILGAEHVLPNLWVGEDPEALPLGSLPRPCVIKTAHGWGDGVFLRDGDDVDAADVRRRLRRALARDQSLHADEWNYAEVPRRILVEPMMVGPYGGVPADFKFHVFHGRARYVLAVEGRFGERRRGFYDLGWRRLPFAFLDDHDGSFRRGEISRPGRLDAMREMAERLAAGFDYVRIDLYDAEGGVIFGEATFFPEAGYGAFVDPAHDRLWGAHWREPGPRLTAGAGSAMA